jgi:ATP-binding cassette, subfamily B, bacterial
MCSDITADIVLLFRSLSKQITIGDVTMYMSAYRASLGSLSALVKTIADIYGNHLFIQDLRGILLYQPRIRRSPHARIVEKDMPLAIEFEHVWFRYQGESPWVLSDVSFRLDTGVRMALVGDNGSGKTMLLTLTDFCSVQATRSRSSASRTDGPWRFLSGR